MTLTNLIWYSAEREELPDIAFGVADFGGRQPVSPYEFGVSYNAVARVGFSRDRVGALDYQPPAIFMLRDDTAAETFSWLRVYAKQIFPLSQFGRVINASEWKFFEPDGAEAGAAIRTDKWASIVLGEILAQGDGEIEIENVPISRAQASFSYAIARAQFLHNVFAVTRECSSRLRSVASDPRVAKRIVSIDSLTPIWAAVSSRIGDVLDPIELVELTIQVVESSEGGKYSSSLRNLIRAYPGFFSDSVEERVLAFQRLASELVANVPSAPGLASANGALLGLAAFLVGRSTSHAFLLRRVPNFAPSAFLWFGLVAAMSGARSWDNSWSRISKAIERQIRASFDWQDPASADVCWQEFKWLSDTFKGTQGFSDLARITPRTLTIEIVPGVVSQFRVPSSDNKSQIESEAKRQELSPLDPEVRATLEQFITVSNKARRLLENMQSKNDVVRQTDLGFTEIAPSRAKSKRTHKKK